MSNEKRVREERCKHCGEILDTIWFTAQMTEEWSWNGWHWECTARHSLVTDPDQSVICPNCERVVGTGRNFGFGTGYK
jgi:hypothetical protein